MSRMTKVATTQAPSTPKPLLGYNTGCKLDSIPHHIDLFDESVCESAEENLLHLDQLKSPPSSHFQSSSNLFELPKPTKTSTPNQPWEGFFLRTKKTNVEDPRKSKWLILTHTQLFVTLNPNHPLFWINLILNPRQFTLQTVSLHLMTHLKMWINLNSVNPPAPLPI